ncbi:MAG: hypothetical protein ACSHX3_01415 [Litorimonas sp.]
MRALFILPLIGFLSACADSGVTTIDHTTALRLQKAEVLVADMRQSLDSGDTDFMTFDIELAEDARQVRMTGILQETVTTDALAAFQTLTSSARETPSLLCSEGVPQRFNAIGTDYVTLLVDRAGTVIQPELTCSA